MGRKKWTAREEVTDSLLKFREKRKWQLALRRYIIEKNISETYAPYFGLDIENYRKWIELQFSEGLSWDNFGSLWQFDHIVPVSYFDYSDPDELTLCWSFINIRVEKMDPTEIKRNRIDILSVKSYFEGLYNSTGYRLCEKMLEKIKKIESLNVIIERPLENFIVQNKELLEKLATLSSDEFSRLNKGMSLGDIFLERQILSKFG